MHATHDHTHISRRTFATMAVAGAGLSFLPLRAWAAAPCEALCIMCIDYRCADSAVRFLQNPPNAQDPGLGLPRDYDITALAGASLASISGKFPGSIDATWNQIKLAYDLHKIKRVIVIDHRDCGAYEAEYGRKPKDDCEEYEWHRDVMQRMKAVFDGRGWSRPPYNLGLDFYLMPKPGDDNVPRRLPLPYYRPEAVNLGFSIACPKAA
jgi:hypothetical protein